MGSKPGIWLLHLKSIDAFEGFLVNAGQELFRNSSRFRVFTDQDLNGSGNLLRVSGPFPCYVPSLLLDFSPNMPYFKYKSSNCVRNPRPVPKAKAKFPLTIFLPGLKFNQ